MAAAAKRARGASEETGRKVVLLCCDVQERFRAAIWEFEAMSRSCAFLVDVFAELRLPVVATGASRFGPAREIRRWCRAEQVPEKLGKTVETVTDALGRHATALGQSAPKVFSKAKFSMLTDEVVSCLDEAVDGRWDLATVVIGGIETHVCVRGTVLELLSSKGARVLVASDAVSSSRRGERSTCLHELGGLAGCSVVSCEAVAFALMGSAEHPSFRAVSKMVRARGGDGEALLSSS
jgi:nicotinamidase-related amidase